jgi:hypothetical protein
MLENSLSTTSSESYVPLEDFEVLFTRLDMQVVQASQH